MFVIDKQWSSLLLDFFLDIAKAFFIATFITPFSYSADLVTQTLVLIKGLSNVIIYLLFARFIKNYELD